MDVQTSSGKPLEDLVDKWERRGNRVASSAWVYHLGMDAFCLGEHLPRGRRATSVFGGLLVRDAWTARRVLNSSDSQSTSERAAVVGLVSDLVAALALRKAIPRDVFRADRSLSQFGLSAGWAIQFGTRQGRMRTVASHLAPVLTQTVFAFVWRLTRRQKATYVIQEAMWSLTALLCVRHLSDSLRAAVNEGKLAASSLAALREAEAEFTAREWTVEQTSHSLINQTLREFKMWLEVIEGSADSPLYRLATAESERLRNFPETDTYTTESLVLLMTNLRDTRSEPLQWNHVGSQSPSEVFTLSTDVAKIQALIEASVKMDGPISVDTRQDSQTLTISVAGRFPPSETWAACLSVDDRTPDGPVTISMTLGTQGGRFT